MTLAAVIKAGPTANATTRTYERRRRTALNLISMLSAAENTHHNKATASLEPALTGAAEPKWKDCTDLGLVITTLGQALQLLGMSTAEIELLMRVEP